MKCIQCGGKMTEKVGEYRLLEIPHVVLYGVTTRRCTECGESEVAIPRMEGMFRTLAGILVKLERRLVGSEIRFLRKYLGWSGKDFAEHFGVTSETVSRWENDKKDMGPLAERLLRVCVFNKEPVVDYESFDLRKIAVTSVARPAKVRLRESRGSWAEASA